MRERAAQKAISAHRHSTLTIPKALPRTGEGWVGVTQAREPERALACGALPPPPSAVASPRLRLIRGRRGAYRALATVNKAEQEVRNHFPTCPRLCLKPLDAGTTRLSRPPPRALLRARVAARVQRRAERRVAVRFSGAAPCYRLARPRGVRWCIQVYHSCNLWTAATAAEEPFRLPRHGAAVRCGMAGRG